MHAVIQLAIGNWEWMLITGSIHDYVSEEMGLT